LVSTIIPVYNRPSQLREAADSVLKQDYRPIELVIVDDGSTDDTPDVAGALAAEHPDIVRFARQANAGPGAARERGRAMASGEFIQYLDSDDLLLPGKFRAQVTALRSAPKADVAYGITYVRDANGLLVDTPHKKTGEPMPAMFPEFLVSRWWETATPLYRSSVTDKAGAWTELSLEEDWEYDCRVASLGGKLVWVPLPVSEHRDHGGLRLSRGSETDKQRLRQRSQAHGLIFQHALAFGLTPDCPQMQHFARALFLLSRQCGAAGLADDSRVLFDLACQASGSTRAAASDFRIYASGARLLGWSLMGRVSRWLDLARK
jgi:hypothetical protein